MVSDVNNNSLQLVEMCSSEGVWSPVCDNNWTLQDATVVCRELDNQGLTYLKAYMVAVSLFFMLMIESTWETSDLIGSRYIAQKMLQFCSYLPKQDGTHIFMPRELLAPFSY